MISAEEILTSKEKFKINLGLDRIQYALKIFNHPEIGMKIIHVAGTNGKGSVCTIIENILIKSGKNVGKYTSPHLFSYCERFSYNGKNIEENKLDELINLVNKKDSEYKIGLSEFETLTVVCFLYFKEMKADYLILEVGLGGRLDATNVILHPIISVITSISYDHKERLGSSIDEIAFEKAGIIKKGSPVVFLRENKGYSVLKKEAIKKGALILPDNLDIKLNNNAATIEGKDFYFALNGDFQKENLKLALLALRGINFKIEDNILKEALSSVKWKFRMQKAFYKNKEILIDGCHNPDGARALEEYIKKYHNKKKIKFIFGCLQNKDYNAILNILYKKEYDFCFYEFKHKNSLKFNEIKNFKMRKITDPISEIEKGDFDLTIFSGSLYMLGEIFKNVNLD